MFRTLDARWSVGDGQRQFEPMDPELDAGHALCGPVAVRGESSGTAIECGMARARLRFELLPDLRLAMPRARTPAGFITFGFDEDLDKAMEVALGGMLEVLAERYHLARREALALSSTVVELRVTQVVNGVRGVPALLPDGAIF